MPLRVIQMNIAKSARYFGLIVYNLLNSMYLIHASIYFAPIRAKQVHLDSKLWGLIKTKTHKKTFLRFGRSVVLKVRF